MSKVEWVIYLIGENGNGRVVEFSRGDDEALDGTEIPISLLAKETVIRIGQEITE